MVTSTFMVRSRKAGAATGQLKPRKESVGAAALARKRQQGKEAGHPEFTIEMYFGVFDFVC
ncbi:hypothetical protein HNR42_002320 [Deinobacterium chartae]|uniref:Uncharacterized protein n=1 Tax=Deinobacterium chartae TaxID=521158 RepID=A0A841I4S4_9DEIO|nr:hypothetical protein [Deinobacterium chartae]MBB6098885.1 hypothetical protein [Deinobacterium chartae]